MRQSSVQRNGNTDARVGKTEKSCLARGVWGILSRGFQGRRPQLATLGFFAGLTMLGLRNVEQYDSVTHANPAHPQVAAQADWVDDVIDIIDDILGDDDDDKSGGGSGSGSGSGSTGGG